MKRNDKQLALLVHIGQCERLVGSVAKSQLYDLATFTHRSRAELASVRYKMIKVPLLGETTHVL